MSAPYVIEDLRADDAPAVEACARILVEAFRGHSVSWPDEAAGLETVREVCADGALARIARGGDGHVLGWIGALHDYEHAWEVHPLAVAPEHQRGGIGRALLRDVEEHAAARGIGTLWLGTDDEDGRTSLGGVDPYPDPLALLQRIQNPGAHPFEFYQRCGFVIVGMLPDANGPGKPDIFMAKRVMGAAR